MWVALSLLFTSGTSTVAAETLEDALRAVKVPVEQFPASVLAGKITSFAASSDGPSLLAYYEEDGSGFLRPPLHVVRYERATGSLRRADLRDVSALFPGTIPMNCLGSATDIREYGGRIYIDTHVNPPAGCVIVLSQGLELRAALSGRLLGNIGADYAILQRSEVHFTSVHPTHIAVFDVKRNESTEVYPYADDPHRRQFSQLIKPLISGRWCRESNAQCDPDNFSVSLRHGVMVNEAARLFAFQAEFDPVGFGPAAEKQVPARTVTYLFRERGGKWEHREFDALQLEKMLGGMSLGKLIADKPDLAFQAPSGR